MSSHDATLEFEYGTASRARIVAESVRREIGEIDDDRSQTTIERDGQQLFVHVDAADVVALRAALNTWFSLVSVAEQSVDVATATLEDGDQ